jgi:hypothetical protein
MNRFFSGLIAFILSLLLYFNMGVKVRPNLADKGLNEIFWPTVLLVMLMGLSIILLVSGIIQARKNNEKLFQIKAHAIFNMGAVRFIIAIIACFGYAASLRYLGFLIATPLMLIVMLFLLGFRGFLRLVPTPVIITLILTFCFSNLTRLALPTGIGIFKTINLLVR